MCKAHLRTKRQNNLNIYVLFNTGDAHDLCYYINYMNYSFNVDNCNIFYYLLVTTAMFTISVELFIMILA
jgi:hypothetical protein